MHILFPQPIPSSPPVVCVALTFTDIAESVSSTAVVTCEDYACSDGYEYKDDYGSITCTDDCDDDQCCELGGYGVSERCTITTYVCINITHTIHRLAVRSLPCGKKAIVFII